MTTSLDVVGPAAPPRSNGELVFAEPWESRAFGLAMALADRGVVSYEAFRERLIAQIADWEADHPERESFSYYRCWLRALEQLVLSENLLSGDDLARRSRSLAERPPGHDHKHGHDHDHG